MTEGPGDWVEKDAFVLPPLVRHAKQEKWPEDVVDFLTDFLENFGAGGDDEDEED